MIKLYHWKTKSFAHHKATDELYQELSKNIDLFVEVLNGKNENRIEMLSHHLKLYDFTNKTELKIKMFEFRQLLVDLDRTFDPRDDSDLFSIRDDMLINVNQFLYLMTMDK
jgi:DNA-binding ferritin-like protein